MIIYGKQLFFHLLSTAPETLRTVYLAKECEQKIFSRIAALKVPIVRLDQKRAQAMAKGGNHQGFLADIVPLEPTPFERLKEEKFLVMLYGLTDMGNIGAICRSAYAFGAGGLIVANIKNLNLESVVRTSSGAAFDMPIAHVQDGLGAMNELVQYGFTLYGADAKGKDVRRLAIASKKVLVLGSEGEGVPQKALNRCHEKVAIPMARAFDSLNVSAAAAVLCDRMTNE